ncbi:MAG: RidA family protein, partial [Mangrovicoccus sp.]
MRSLIPNTIAPPFARYAHGVEVPPGARWVATSGQLGLARDGSIPDAVFDQAMICFENIAQILADADMSAKNIVRLNAFVTDRAHMSGYMKARDAWLAEIAHLPASTLMIVS